MRLHDRHLRVPLYVHVADAGSKVGNGRFFERPSDWGIGSVTFPAGAAPEMKDPAGNVEGPDKKRLQSPKKGEAQPVWPLSTVPWSQVANAKYNEALSAAPLAK